MAGKILIVDDDLELLDEILDFLRSHGFDVITADTGGYALTLARDEGYDVAVLDIKLPDMSGIDLARRLKELRPTAQYIMVTAYATLDNAIGAVRNRVFDFITKPFDPGKLLAAIKEAMKANEAIERNRAKEQRVTSLKKEVDGLLQELNKGTKYGA